MFDNLKAIVTIKKSIKMKNYKTLLSGILTIMPTVLGFFGIPFPQEISHSIEVLGVAFIAYFAKDKDVTGGTRNQNEK